MNPNNRSLLPSAGKLVLALPALAGASRASADIIYTEFAPSEVSSAGAVGVGFNLDGSAGLSNAGSYHFTITAKNIIDAEHATLSNGFVFGIAESDSLGSLYSPGEIIGPSSPDVYSFGGGGQLDVDFGVPFYLGLEETSGASTIYGWAEAEAISGSDVELLAVAYENSGGSIAVGDTGAVPEPKSFLLLAGLASGTAAAFAARRKRRAKSAAAIA